MNEDAYRNLVSLLKLFKNRPYHLAKYLSENKALSKDFIDKISKSDRLKSISEDNSDKKEISIYFPDISKMDDYFSSLMDMNSINDKSNEELSKEFNLKLNELIINEKYEEAAAVRDFMLSKGIKRTNKF